MRILVSVTAVMLFLFLLTSLPALSQDHDDHPQTQDEHTRNRDNGKQNDHATQQDQDRRDDSRVQEDKREHPEAGRSQDQSRPEHRNDHADRDQNRAQHEEQPRQDERARVEGGREGHAQRGERIPEDRYRASFGRGHHFHVDRDLIVNRSQPEFVYSGYTFELAQAWPMEWSYDDDCYIEQEEDGDYYLYDTFHPGFRILVFVIGG